jgi:SWI/SNF-related matrix-associated actin-dependent regulator of chromatin subfamily A3
MTGQGMEAVKAYRHLLEILLRLRQVCNHWKLCGPQRVSALLEKLESQKVVDLTPENCLALQQLLQLSIDSQEDCPVCLDPAKEPAITACSHVFCSACIERVIETQHKCPMCRAEIPSIEHLVRPAQQSDEPPLDIDTPSSKIEALLAILKASSANPADQAQVQLYTH